MERVEGYYWCKYSGEWGIFSWDGFYFWLAGWEGLFLEQDFEEIDERRVRRIDTEPKP